MSITNQTRSITYTANGSTHTFAINTFPYNNVGDLVVTLNGAAQVLGSDYEIIGTYPNQSVHFITYILAVKTDNPPAAGLVVKVERITAIDQPVSFRAQGAYFAKIHESAFDKLCMEIQDISGIAQLIATLNASLIYDLHMFYIDAPTDGALMARWLIPRTVGFPTNMSGSRCIAKVAPTGAVTLTIKKNGTQVGTISFTGGNATGTFSGASWGVVAGDVVTIENQATADATLEAISASLVGTRSL